MQESVTKNVSKVPYYVYLIGGFKGFELKELKVVGTRDLFNALQQARYGTDLSVKGLSYREGCREEIDDINHKYKSSSKENGWFSFNRLILQEFNL